MMNLNCCAVISIDENLNRGEFLYNAISGCTKDYIFFTSEKTDITAESELIESMIRKCRRWKADIVIPVNPIQHLDIFQAESVFDLQFFMSQFSFCPMLDGKLFRTRILKEFLKNFQDLDWIHSPCPDIFIFLTLKAKVYGVQNEAAINHNSFRTFVRNWPKAKAWLNNHSPEEEKLTFQKRILNCESCLIDTSVSSDYNNEEMLPLFASELLANILYTYYPERLSCFRFSRCEVKRRPVRIVGIFCWTLSQGGAERCASLILKELASWPNLKVVLFQTKPRGVNDYPLPENVSLVVFPRNATERFAVEEKILQEQKIDTCVYFDHAEAVTMMDILLANRLGIRTISMEHTTFSFIYYAGIPDLFNLKYAVYKTVDIITCLSRSDEFIWNEHGIQARYMPNPLTFAPEEKTVRKLKDKTLVFIAKMIPEKGAEAVIQVADIVRKKHPDVKLLMLGAFPDPEYEKMLRKKVKELHLEGTVDFIGFTTKVEYYLEQASVHLMPSIVEGYPMTVMEVKAYGIPTVSFSMPYLEAVKEEYGCVIVGKQDIEGMAAAVSALFDDLSYLNEMGCKAKASLKLFGNDIVYHRWRMLFEYLETGTKPSDLLPPAWSLEKKYQFMCVENQELVCAVNSMLFTKNFRYRMEGEVLQRLKQRNPIFSFSCKIDRLIKKITPPNGEKGGVLYRGIHFSGKVLMKIAAWVRRVYRSHIPWEEDNRQDF